MLVMRVRQTGDPVGVFIHDETASSYADVAMFGDGLRLAGYACQGERYRDKASGYESWTFRDATDQGRAAIVVALIEEG